MITIINRQYAFLFTQNKSEMDTVLNLKRTETDCIIDFLFFLYAVGGKRTDVVVVAHGRLQLNCYTMPTFESSTSLLKN